MQKKQAPMVDESVNTGYTDRYGNYIHAEDTVMFYPDDNTFLLTWVESVEGYGYCLMVEDELLGMVAFPIMELDHRSMVIQDCFYGFFSN